MDSEVTRVEFTREMKKDYTILIPNMAPIHFELIKNVFALYGYKVELLHTNGREIVDTGLKYVHNDTCYPALLCIGQLISALESGKYDLSKTALIITQTGGGCRASNYIHLLRKALVKAGYGHIPVISLNLSGLEKNSGFHITLSMLVKALYCIIYGDLLMLLDNQVRPYELNAGDSARLVERWTDTLTREFNTLGSYSPAAIRRNLRDIVRAFDAVPRAADSGKVKVGVVGEIYVKYSPLANNDLVDFLVGQDCEVMVPGMMGFMLFKTDNRIEDIRLYGGNQLKKLFMQALLSYFEKMERMLIDAVKRYSSFNAPSPYAHLKALAARVIGPGCKMGEGWLLTAEMMELIESGYGNVVCTQPFGCLPNHIVGKGMIRKLRELYPSSNIVPIDYDPGATRVNQENRIKLMLSVAREKTRAV